MATGNTDRSHLNQKPKIVTLCGSTRFKADFEQVAAVETLAGRIVLTVGVFGHADGFEPRPEVKDALDALHLRKIDLADEILVINPGGYIGESTSREIAYATAAGIPIRYLCPENTAVKPETENPC
jgi:hypothetical protein